MDDTVQGIFFDEKGECNFCKIHNEMEKEYPHDESLKKRMDKLIDVIKKDGKGKKYDCIVGVSGGIDSTYSLYIAVKIGLRPLAVHMDNGWDSELAVNNIERMLKKMGVELHTIVLDWEEFKDLQISFLKASVPDVEMPTDVAITSVLYRVTKEEKLHYILNGQSFRTGGKCPIAWNYGDKKYIKSVHQIFGNKKIKSFPNLSIEEQISFMFINKIKFVPILNYVDYDVNNVKNLLEREVNWRDYNIKHYESIYTRFVQSYLLPKKFNIDKRKIHFSALIRSGQMTREKALENIKELPYQENKIEEDKEYVIKKFGFTKEEFEEIMSRQPKLFLDYPNSFRLQRFLIKFGYKIGKLSKKHKYYEWNSLLKT